MSNDLPGITKDGSRRAYVYTNELPYISELGGEIESVIAAWTSPVVDRGLNEYARWSLAELGGSHPLRKRWLKPTLLATYGVLAAKPKHTEFGFKRASGGEEKVYPAGGEQIEVIARRTSKELEMPIANVIHRGMIEAETRLRSLRMAKELHRTYKMSVLAVYADSVFVESHTPIPLLAPGWEVEGHLTNLVFYSATTFMSVELEKMPGVTPDQRAKARQRNAWRAVMAEESAIRAGRRRKRYKKTA